MATGDTASDPSPRPWPNEGEEGSLTSNKGTEKSWPARNGQGSSIAKEHGRRPGRDGQEVRPSTRDLIALFGSLFAPHPDVGRRRPQLRRPVTRRAGPPSADAIVG